MKKLLFLFALLAALSARAKVVTKSVSYEQGGVKLEGFLAYDDAKTAEGKLPGVLVVPEWWGLNDYAKHRAEMLAGLGYVAFAVDMYGGGQSTTEAAKARELSSQFYGKPLMAERARAALDQLLATHLVDETKVAAIGYCFGGAVCQTLAYSGAPLAGIVSFHGSLVPAPVGASNKAKFLICHGALDPFSKPEAIAVFQKSLNDGGFDYQFISYAGAVHAFTNPEADAMAKKNGLSGIGYNAAADHRSWQAMEDFFHEIFGGAR
ncbi:MAG TPA: dienelactone hydrolase family protein [Opitutaceae bacterium]|nr:dienelactone hydrolase family protein [Opitutaceae bacterium]